MAYCPKCGASLPDPARFCGICGAQLAVPANDPYRQQQPASDNSRQYTQPQQPVYDNRQARQYTQPQQPVYDNRQARQYTQPQQPVYSNRQARQQAPDYPYARQPAYGNDYGWSRPEPRQKPVRHAGFLRLLSLLFAVGLIAAAAAFGCRLYFNRTVHDDFLDSMLEPGRESMERLEEQYRNKLVSEEDYTRQKNNYNSSMEKTEAKANEYLEKYEDDLREVLAAAIRKDPDGLKSAVKNAAVHMMKTENTDISKLTGSDQTLSAFYSEKKADIDLLLANWLKDLDNQSILKPLNKISGIGSEKFSFRWLMLQVGARWMLILIAGGGLAFLCFLLWLICRGPSAGAGRSWFVPMLFIAILLGAALIAASFWVVKPVGYREIADAVTEQAESKEDMAEWNAIGSELTDQAVNGVVKESDTLKNILPNLQSDPDQLVTPETLLLFLNSSDSISVI